MPSEPDPHATEHDPKAARTTGTPSEPPAAPDPAEAQAMIDALASVDVRYIDRAFTDASGRPVEYRREITYGDLRAGISRALDRAVARHHNLIIRPHQGRLALIQLDDLPADTLDRLTRVAFLAIETSPGNFQGWLALPIAEYDLDLRGQLHRSTGADPGATGAVRIAGSINFKDRHAPDHPLVRLVHTLPGRVTPRTELESLGLVAEPESLPAEPAKTSPPAELDSMVIGFDLWPRARRPRAWPRYDWCLKGAPLNSAGTGPDRSRADFTWCKTAIQWGWSVEQTAERLQSRSEKAQERTDDYALRTARAAAEAVRGSRRG